MKQLVVATNNPGKAREFARLLGDQWDVKTLKDFQEIPDIVEDGDTFEANARKKALTVSQVVDGYVLADDSGIEVDALDGAPGIYSARYAGTHGDDEGNNRKLLAAMKDVPEGERGGQFRCVLVLAKGKDVLGVCEGIVRGSIMHEVSGEGGFGYDPLFLPDGEKVTFGVLPSERKHEISHRGKATREMIELLGKLE